MQCISVEYAWQSIRIRSNKEIIIRTLSVSVRIADIRKISIRGYLPPNFYSSLFTKQGRKNKHKK